MPPVASKLSSKLKSWVTIDDSFTTDGAVVLCQACNKKITCSMKSQLEQHVRSALHTRNKALQTSKKQVLLSQMQQSSSARNEFFYDMCTAMVAANIPWYKLQVPKYRAFLEKYCGRQIPNDSTLRKNYLHLCYEEALAYVRRHIGSNYIWIAVDETTDVKGRYVANLVIGKLDGEESPTPFLISSKVLEHTNHATVARFVNDGLKVLWPEGVQEDKVLVLYSDAAAYMLKAGTALRVFYQNMIHFTCLAHGLQRVAEEVRSKYPQVNSIISNTKKVFVKAPQRVLHYREQLPNVKLPPEPVLTRWGTWIEAACFYSEHFKDVKSVIDSFPGKSAVSVRDAQSAFSDSEVQCQLAYIQSNFGFIADSILKLETRGMPLKKSLDIVEDVKSKLSAVEGTVGIEVMKKFESVMERNPGFSTMTAVCKILSGEEENPPDDISPEKFNLLKFAPATSCDVERSFSVYKNILSDRRHSMTMENLEMYLIVHCNSE